MGCSISDEKDATKTGSCQQFYQELDAATSMLFSLYR
jgi:hypothetical protein